MTDINNNYFEAIDDQVELTSNLLTSSDEITKSLKPNYPKHEPEELKEAVRGAQKNDAISMQKLYEWYHPLVRSISSSYTNYSNLGEDAENIAWVIFYDCIKKYQSEDFVHFPGYVKRVLITRMCNAAQLKAYSNILVATDDLILMTEATTPDDYWEEQIENIDLRLAISKLKNSQQEIIKHIYFEQLSCSKIADLLNKSIDTVHYHHYQSLKRLRKYYRVKKST